MDRRFPTLISLFVFLLGVSFAVAEDAELDLSLGAVIDNSVGIDWPLEDGKLAHLRIIDQCFHLFFLDSERKIIEPLFATAILRGEETRDKSAKVVRQLTRGSGPFLQHPRHNYPPYDFWLSLVIPGASGDEGNFTTLSRQRFRQ